MSAPTIAGTTRGLAADAGGGPRVAIVGAGMIGRIHFEGALRAGARVEAVISSTESKSRDVSRRWGVDSDAVSIEDVLESDVDVVHICTPNSSHASLAAAVAARGKHVIVEKPIGVSLDEAESLARTVRDAGIVGTVPFVYRYHPLVREIRHRRAQGELGEINFAHGTYLQDWLFPSEASSWRVDPAIGGASRAFADIGSHWVDLVEWTSGVRFTELVAASQISVPSRPEPSVETFAVGRELNGSRRDVTTEDSVALVLKAPGAIGSLAVSQLAAGRKNRLWFELDGSQASAVFDQENPETVWFGGYESSQVVARNPNTGSPEQRRLSHMPAGHAQGYADCFAAFIDDSYALVRGEEREGVPTIADGVRAARFVDAMLRSSHGGAWEQI